ncbi:hypothetical protein BABINDRAFT_178592 [Babjeviella inositovora NRRL Y-12698]|uniref:RING-type domain-containing protein n=1 Tax=Babjeviella inositovora NRRL Y-12698 TaxID=984486 RepID=A0A1E3QX05_9ASCO|nr:uncharacterized protein BABINDRAFT_178592 [Babjeviella inositovora NRRL Y-12698]ODQ82196.1 hypothetical protein BABINDRAFT_178592 [Babjeviella inositovora NRRL Y-12698]
MLPPQSDSFISDEEEDYCPLCVEELDISDKNFKPCPCGYQICQFCYNNIRQNPELNGKCPACRRTYDDESVEYRQISTEEYKLFQSKKERKDRERKEREKAKKENEQLSRKHLSGMRVIQKNLVYVVGLNPPVNSDELHNVLRLERYFGQYGKILKIVVNKRTPNPTSHHITGTGLGFGVYVTFARKEDAARCINAVDGSLLDGRTLKAAYGTTKYCLLYLRGQACPNPNCMFLHEPGEEADLYTRQDLSTRAGIKMGSAMINGREIEIMEGGFILESTPLNVNAAFNTPISHVNAHTPLSEITLPLTAAWASKSAATPLAGSPAISNTPLANESAFPTLAEMQQQQAPAEKRKKEKSPGVGTDADGGVSPYFATDDDAQFASQFVRAGANLVENYNKLNYAVRDVDDRLADFPPLFAFNVDVTAHCKCDSSIINKLVETLLFRPYKALNGGFVAPVAPQAPPPPHVQQMMQQHMFNKMRDTATPPPPGLFAGQSQAYMQQMQQFQKPPPAGVDVGANSSELLSQLMNGKKIGA